MIVSLMIGFGLIVYDSQILAVFDLIIQKEEPTTMEPHFWFIVGPVIDRLYTLITPKK